MPSNERNLLSCSEVFWASSCYPLRIILKQCSSHIVLLVSPTSTATLGLALFGIFSVRTSTELFKNFHLESWKISSLFPAPTVYTECFRRDYYRYIEKHKDFYENWIMQMSSYEELKQIFWQSCHFQLYWKWTTSLLLKLFCLKI